MPSSIGVPEGRMTRSSGPIPERISAWEPLSPPSLTSVRRATPSRTTKTTPPERPVCSTSRPTRHREAPGILAEGDDGLAVHPVKEEVAGVWQVDLDAHHPLGVLGPGDPREGPRERLAVEGIDADHGRVADPGEDDVAVGDQDDHAHDVGTLDRQQRQLSALGGRADEGPRVERPVGHDSIKRSDDPGVLQVDLRPVQVGLGDPQHRLGVDLVRLGLARSRPGRPASGPWRSGWRSATVRSAAMAASSCPCCSSTSRCVDRVLDGQTPGRGPVASRASSRRPPGDRRPIRPAADRGRDGLPLRLRPS